MELIIDQHFRTLQGRHLGMLRRVYQSESIPPIGISIEDHAWKDVKKLNDVIFNPGDHYCMLYVDDEIVKEEHYAELINAFKLHKWKSLSEVSA